MRDSRAKEVSALDSIGSETSPQADVERNEEHELVAAVLRKDRKATAEFVSRFADVVYSYVYWRLAPANDAVEDLVQDVFLEAWRSLARYRGDGGLAAWLVGIARHKVQDHYRRVLRNVNSRRIPAPRPRNFRRWRRGLSCSSAGIESAQPFWHCRRYTVLCCYGVIGRERAQPKSPNRLAVRNRFSAFRSGFDDTTSSRCWSRRTACFGARADSPAAFFRPLRMSPDLVAFITFHG